MIYISSDHAGFSLKEELLAIFKSQNIEVEDLGPFTFDPTDDYPDYAYTLAKKVVQESTKGILICGTGSGMAIVANKIKGARATVCDEENIARMSRNHNDSNILVIKATSKYHGIEDESVPSPEQVREYANSLSMNVINPFINTMPSNEERHIRRREKIRAIEELTMK